MQTWRLCWKKDLQTATSSNRHPSTGFVMHHGCSKMFKTPFSCLPSDAQSDTNIISVPKTPTNHLHGEKASNPVQWLTLKQCTIDMKHYDQICNLKGWPTIWHHIHQAKASSSVSYLLVVCKVPCSRLGPMAIGLSALAADRWPAHNMKNTHGTTFCLDQIMILWIGILGWYAV